MGLTRAGAPRLGSRRRAGEEGRAGGREGGGGVLCGEWRDVFSVLMVYLK